MNFYNLSHDYYLRKWYLDRDQVPTQSLMKKKMSPNLAAIYFKSMNHKLKIIAGIEPPMKGGGDSWYIPPQELLHGRVVMKPLKKEYMAKLNYIGVDGFGIKLVQNHRRQMNEERERALQKSDTHWKHQVEKCCHHEWEEISAEAANNNTKCIHNLFDQFTTLYNVSLNKFQDMLLDATIGKIKACREDTFQIMQINYNNILQHQATMLYDKYADHLKAEKAKLKKQFQEDLEKLSNVRGDRLHNINLEKHIAIEKTRKYLECQKLACQIFVTLKEHKKCIKDTDLSKKLHKRKIKLLTDTIILKDHEIQLAEENEKKRREFNILWMKKVCQVVKKFQMFILYCLKTLPEHADFFIDMEKLMLLQLNETLENPTAESIFIEEEEDSIDNSEPNPFYLVCDQHDQVKTSMVNKNLCPKHDINNASQLPAIVINKRCVYAACDNFEQFIDKIKSYIEGGYANESHLLDDYVYSHAIPVKYKSSERLRELKLESSLLRILQEEIANIKEVPVLCPGQCGIAHCFNCYDPYLFTQNSIESEMETNTIPSLLCNNQISSRSDELAHEREPKWDSYLKYIKPKKCDCLKVTKKHLQENLPLYMRKSSYYDAANLPNYKTCSVNKLKALVKRAKGESVASPSPKTPSNTREMSTQCVDNEFDNLCTCFSDENINSFYEKLLAGNITPNLISSSLSGTYLTKDSKTFATERAVSLLRLIQDSPEIKEIFKRADCTFP